VILYHDPGNADQVDGVTWDGASSGRVVATGGRNGLVPNLSGSLYAAYADRGIYDRTGALLVRPFGGTQQDFGTWADDGRHYCQMVATSGFLTAPATLVLGTAGQQARSVAQLGPIGSGSGAAVAACSIERDRAVVFGMERIGDNFVPTLWVLRLSTGGLLWKRTYPVPQGPPTLDIVASRDGQYIVENRYDYVGASPAFTATVLDANGSRLRRIDGEIRAFSWDGSLAVLNDLNHPSVIRWLDGHVVWTAPGGVGYYEAFPEPEGRRVAIAVLTSYVQTCLRLVCHSWPPGQPPQDLYAVGPDGPAAELLSMKSVAFPACPPKAGLSQYGVC
jgi:hypothetical protein